MKLINTGIGMLVMVAITMASCTKAKNTTATTPTTTGTAATMTASGYGFDGAAGKPFSATAAGIVQAAGTLTITGINDGTKESIGIVLFGITDTGTYTLDKDNKYGNGATISKDNTQPANFTLTYSTDNTEAVTNKTGGGSVHITTITTTDAEGTFNITAYNTAGKAAFAEQGKFKGKINK